jgi:hypothetical protein
MLLLLLLLFTISKAGSCADLEKICYNQCISRTGSQFIFAFLESCVEYTDNKVQTCYTPPGCKCTIPDNLRSSSAPTDICTERSCSAVNWATLIPSSTKWCTACADNCNGFQNNCIDSGKFCRINNRCAGLNMCSRWRADSCMNGIYSNETCDGVVATPSPTARATGFPTQSPTVKITDSPSVSPTVAPTLKITDSPTVSPTLKITGSPTVAPTQSPTVKITDSPSYSPTQSPTLKITGSPTVTPTQSTTVATSTTPTQSPTIVDISYTPSTPSTPSPTQNTSFSETENMFKIAAIAAVLNIVYCSFVICIVFSFRNRVNITIKEDNTIAEQATVKNVYRESNSLDEFVDILQSMDSTINKKDMKRKIRAIELRSNLV